MNISEDVSYKTFTPTYVVSVDGHMFAENSHVPICSYLILHILVCYQGSERYMGLVFNTFDLIYTQYLKHKSNYSISV